MFANLMKNDEKKDFLELVYKIANCDGEYSDDEEELINNYKIELGINEIPDTKSLEELVIAFSSKSTQLKKIVFFELYGMILADGKIADTEQDILNIIKENLLLEENSCIELINIATELKNVYDKIYSAIFD